MFYMINLMGPNSSERDIWPKADGQGIYYFEQFGLYPEIRPHRWIITCVLHQRIQTPYFLSSSPILVFYVIQDIVLTLMSSPILFYLLGS